MTAAGGARMESGRRSLVVFGEDWGRHPSSTQHVVSRLALDRDVIWVNSIGMRRPRFSRADMLRTMVKLSQMAGFSKPVRSPTTDTIASDGDLPARLSVVAPRAISWPGHSLADFFNRRSIGQQLRSEIKRRKLRDPIFWASLPTALPMVGTIGESKLVYYCGDDFGGLAGVDHAPVLAMEKSLADKADMVLACSPLLAHKFPRSKTRLVPHGVDLSLFRRAAPRPADLPDHPRIAGFYGSLASWIDIEAIAAAATSLPDWMFVLIGPVSCDVRALALPNIRLLGEKPHAALPAYLQHWTVSLLPFRDTAQIRACNPLKLREYLAVGKPIVSADFDALAPYRHLIEITPFGDHYAAHILKAAGDGQRDEMRRESVETESWERRAADIGALLDRC